MFAFYLCFAFASCHFTMSVKYAVTWFMFLMIVNITLLHENFKQKKEVSYQNFETSVLIKKHEDSLEMRF